MTEIKILDHPNLIRHRVLTADEKKVHDNLFDRMKQMMIDNGVHIVMNNYVYIPVYENGVRVDKSYRVKVDGIIYKKITEMYGGKLPQHIELVTAETIDGSKIV